MIKALALLAAALLAAAPAAARPADPRLAELTQRTERAEAFGAIKRLQLAYAHFAEQGLWDEMAALFAEDGEARYGAATLKGRAAIAAWLRANHGNGLDGAARRDMLTRAALAPVITFAPDGTARGRWHELGLLGVQGSHALWSGRILDNDYVREKGVWRIARLRSSPVFEGPYLPGFATAPGARRVPIRFDTEAPGLPSAPAAGAGGAASLADLERRIGRLIDESSVERLQNAWGFYLDRRMWDDAADLLAADATLSVAGGGVWRGAAGIRRWLEQSGPAGLRRGELDDQPQLSMLVTVAPGGRAARARGIQLGMTGVHGGDAWWSETLFENSYAKGADGKWRIAAIRLYPKMKASYFEGWGKDMGVEPVPLPAIAFANPVTGRAVRYPRGMAVSAAVPLAAASAAPAAKGDTAARIAEAERLLRTADAYHAAENLLNAYSYFLDEAQWANAGRLFSANGWKELSYVGTYIGRDRVGRSMIARYGERMAPADAPYTAMPVHQKAQPVITVAPDGRSARIRDRLLQFNSGVDAGRSSFTAGIYESAVVLEDGVWRISQMDLDYYWVSRYEGGWARVSPEESRRNAPRAGALDAFPPDRPLIGPAFAPYPEIAAAKFHYANPVSGRAPPLPAPDRP